MTTRPSHPELCIVIPCFNEEDVLPHLVERIGQLELTISFKVLFVDDGSSDGTLAYLNSVCSRDKRMACLGLSRNFGHQSAVSAGLRHADGDVIVILDADLQDPPELLPAFLEKWQEGFDVVYGVRTNRKESYLMRKAYNLFYRLLGRSASIAIPRDAGDFALMDRRVVDVINSMPEQNRFVRGMRAWAGFRQVGVPYKRPSRYAGQTGYNLRRLTKLALDGLIAFSPIPLRFAFWIGSSSFVLGVLFLLWILSQIPLGRIFLGWGYVAALILILGGLQLAVLGIIGEYVGRILEEVRHRPHYVLHHRAGWAADSVQDSTR